MTITPKRLPEFSILTIVRLVIGIAILTGACMVFAGLVATRPAVSGRTESQLTPRVQVVSVEKVEVPRQWIGFGTVRALESADVPARLMAVVSKRHVEPGTQVDTKTPLLTLEVEDFKEQLAAATASVSELTIQSRLLSVEKRWLDLAAKLHDRNVALLEGEVKRLTSLAAPGAINVTELDNARGRLVRAELERNTIRERVEQMPSRVAQNTARLNSAEVTERMRQRDVDRCSIFSPIDGVIQAVNVNVGEPVQAGEKVARIVNLKKVEVGLRLPAVARADIRVGDEVTVSLSSDSPHDWTVKIQRINPQDDDSSRTMEVYVEIGQDDKTGYLLVPGVFVRGEVTGRLQRSRLVLPRRAVRNNRARMVRDGVIVDVPIEVEFTVSRVRETSGLPDDQWVVLADQSSGSLRVKDQVVLNYSAKVRDGQKVHAVSGEDKSTEKRP